MASGNVYICILVSATRIKPFCGFGVPCFFRFASLTCLLAILLLDIVHCISSLIFFAHFRDFCVGRFVSILQKKVIMYWCDLVCIYAGGDVPVTPLHSNLVSGKTGAADRRHSHGIASPHRSTLKVKNCDKKQQTNIMSPPMGFL